MKQDYETLLAALMPEPDEAAYHLTKAEMSGYIKRILDEVSIETAESHLEVCDECVLAVKELRAATYDDAFVFAPNTVVGKEEVSGHKTSAGVMAFLTSFKRPVQVAFLALFALGLVALAIAFMRTRTNQSAQRLTGRDEGANLNTNDSQPDQLRVTDRSADGIDGEQPPSPSGKEKDRTDSTVVSPGVDNEGRGLEKLSPSLQQAIISASTTQTLEKPRALAELNGRSGTLLSESDDGLPFRLLSPVGKVVQNSRPAFHWSPLTGASSYVVTVVDDNLNEIVTSGPLTKTEWSATVPLKRGGIYSWQVTAFKDGQEIVSPVMPAPQAKFMILDQAHLEELNRVKRALPNYHLGLGVFYTRAGLLDEAEREFQAMLRANPRSSVARKLLNSVRSMKK